LVAPLDVSRITNEKGVKTLIKRLLDFHGYFHWMPAANGFGTTGVSDHLALKNGVFVAIEAKFGSNKPKPLQKAFAAQVITNDAFAFCVSEKNIDHLAMWLESFEVATRYQMDGKEVPEEHGARMLNAIAVLTEPFAETQQVMA
jgi:hypothetical protein